MALSDQRPDPKKSSIGFFPPHAEEVVAPPKTEVETRKTEIVAPAPKLIEDLRPPKIKKRRIKRVGETILGILIVISQTVTFLRHFRTITRQTFSEAFEVADGFRSSIIEGLRDQNNAFWDRLQYGIDLITGRYSPNPAPNFQQHSAFRRAINLLVFYAVLLTLLYFGFSILLGWIWPPVVLIFKGIYALVTWPFRHYFIESSTVLVTVIFLVINFFSKGYH